MKRLEESIRNSQKLLRLVGDDVNINLKKAEKNLDIGSSHIKNGYYDSAVNSFRKSMEYLLNSWLLLVSGNDNFFELRGWICWNHDLRCKQLEEVKIKPSNQISFLKDIGLIDQAAYIRFDYLRDVGNRGSHAGNEVEENEALEAQGFIEDLLQNFKQYYSNLAAAFDTPEWHQIKIAQSIATTKYSMRLSDDIDFLEERNEKPQNYIDRKKSRMTNSNSRRERKRLESEINTAKNQIAERQKEIDTVAFTNLQLIQDRELLLSIYDPEGYERMKSKRAEYRQITLAQERKTEQLNKTLLGIGIGVVVAIALFVALYVLFAMG